MFHYNDQVSLTLVSGSGGSGCVSFQRTRTNPRGGPDGGDGGKGGDILLASSAQVKNLSEFKKKKLFKASPGSSGEGQLKSGKKGEDLKVLLPLGTLVRNLKGEVLIDFEESKESLFLEGGRGARGNAFFKTSLNQAPRKAQKGEKGTTEKIILEFKPCIDIALIGEVNSGKSTFFNKVTRAKSPVGDYPYTTLAPYVGQITFFEDRQYLMDIPGLEEGAHKRPIQGLSFLRSLQRARLLLHFVDGHHSNPFESYQKIEQELYSFDDKQSDLIFTKLSEKKRFIILSRIDGIGEDRLKEIKKEFQSKIKHPLFFVSSHKDEGLKELLLAIKKEKES